MNIVKRADWVTTPYGGHGIVRRVSKNGSWADVDWGTHTKRMPVRSLIVLTTIPFGNGWTITDVTRERELEDKAALLAVMDGDE